MRYWALLLLECVLPAAAPGGGQEPAAVPAAVGARQVGQVVIVEDRVAQVTRPQGTSDYFLNFGSAYPNQVLTVVVPAAVALQVPGLAAAAGALVRVRGTVVRTDDGPAIRCSAADQIQLLAAEAIAAVGPTAPGTSPVPGTRGSHTCCGPARACGHHGHSGACGCAGCPWSRR
jgi:hypothetical protein